jgi:23S rRNA (cytidine1920-2'-O)/16S rRNA (cytidine1409-2'-O)-methyltransferase
MPLGTTATPHVPTSSNSSTPLSRRSSTLTKRLRLDAELERRGLARSRSEARRMITEGKVTVGGLPVARPGAMVGSDAEIALVTHNRPFASRGGEKLDDALRRLRVRVAGRRWLDAGASTGGFTDRLLRGGAAHVVAVDVGYGQLAWTLRNDRRVTILERTNVRALEARAVGALVDGIVADLSFISLRLVLDRLAAVARPDADHVLLVKPQFEVGRERVGRGGVVRDPAAWRAAVEAVVAHAGTLGLGLVDAVVARPPGPAGNREFFVHLRGDAAHDPAAIERAIHEARG